ncbi:hypothetical protein F5Y11DRAFT_347279 [Daldinia sp. FL1419]|nr:hypothetical protein F5Y11DRAFT_347279 [Daldinia sp. FL1419]
MADKPTSTSVNKFTLASGSMLPTHTLSTSPVSRITEKTTMAPITSSTESGFKKPLDISSLMSPPEPPRLDSFSQARESRPIGPTVSDARRLHPISPLSPPVSPSTKVDDHSVNTASSANTTVQDPILYPSQDAVRSPQQQPLFAQDDNIDKIVDKHINLRSTFFEDKNTSPPEREDYELLLHFKAQVMKKYQQDPRAWLKRERELLIADRRAVARNNQFKLQPKPILPAKPPQIRKETQRARTAKPAKVVKATQSSTTPRPIRSYPTSNLGQASARLPSVTPDPAPRRAVAPNREDKDFNSITDYCPPLDTLPERCNSLKVDWKGTPIDLSNDPHRDHLHPDEITLAANLRLDCATYLTSKRRMFVRRLECLRMGKEFRKTDAQQACKIDVNKASKLWMAFEKVGWLEKRWMADYV